eukprot:scaffold4262_cov104-Skeletonema_dohrnii-CCMP3373.AAC.1
MASYSYDGVSVVVVLALAAVSDASSGHLYDSCSNSDANMTKKSLSLSRAKDASILSWPTMMGH